MKSLDLNKIILSLSEVAKILHHEPQRALTELRNIAESIDRQIPYYDGHIIRVTNYSVMIGKQLSLSDKDMVTLEAAALLHDFGKIGVDEELLLIPGKLKKKQKAEIEQHVLRGYYILLGFEELEKSLEGVRNHHEQFDGTGYPRGATGINISLLGRIIAVADAFDAMTSERPYRKAKTKKEAIAEVQRCSATEFDPEIVRAFVQAVSTDPAELR